MVLWTFECLMPGNILGAIFLPTKQLTPNVCKCTNAHNLSIFQLTWVILKAELYLNTDATLCTPQNFITWDIEDGEWGFRN